MLAVFHSSAMPPTLCFPPCAAPSPRGRPGPTPRTGAPLVPAPQDPAAPYRVLHVQEPHVLGVAGDEAAARLHILAHEDAEQLIRRGRVVEGDLPEHTHLRVHRGLPQL